MLKSLFPDIDWNRVGALGFDMDGTLYDEADFIRQVYSEISEYLAGALGIDQGVITAKMFSRWQEMGSSYPHIFEEVLADYQLDPTTSGRVIAECIDLFRNFSPSLVLPTHVERLLEDVKADYRLFLVTDGNAKLQRRKFASLGLSRWFADANVLFTAACGKGMAKPSIEALHVVQTLHHLPVDNRVVFFGDRDVDEGFSSNAGFYFVRVKVMHSILN